MVNKHMGWVVAVCLLAAATPATAVVDIFVTQDGTDVLFTLSGSLNTTGADITANNGLATASIAPNPPQNRPAIGFGPPSGGAFDRINNVPSFPQYGLPVFNSNATAFGDVFAVNGARLNESDSIGVPLNYVSEQELSATMRFPNETIFSLGLFEGVFLTGLLPSGDFVRMTIDGPGVPEPMTGTLVLIGVAGLGLRRTGVCHR